MDGDVGRLQEKIKDLQAELEAMEFEKVDLEDQVDSLKKDAAQLLDKDTRVSRERAEERRTLQAVPAPNPI
jgi:cell division protein FtsB